MKRFSQRRAVHIARVLLISVVFGLFCAGTAWSQRIHIDITQPSFQQISIAIPDFKFLSAQSPQLARQMAQTLGQSLEYSGVFRPMDPRGFLEDPQSMGMTAGEIRFHDWRRLGADYLVRSSYEVRGEELRLEARLFDVLSGRMVVGRGYEGESRNWQSMVHRLADEILYAITGERGVFDTKLAYVQVKGNAKEIFICDFDGGNPQQVTSNGSLNLSPSWHPNGSELAFVSYKEGAAKIYSVNVFTGSERLLSGHKGLNIAPAWRPGTSQLAATLSISGSPDIYLLSPADGSYQKLVHSWAINVSPSWSPDGKRLAYVSNETGSPQIYVLDVSTGEKRRITFSGRYNTSPAWSPKGDWIAFSGSKDGRHNIFIVRPDGSDLRQLTHGEGNNESPTWSPDGRMIAFSSTRQGDSSIWVLLTNGTGLRRLTGEGVQEMPHWSPRFRSN